MMTRTLHNPAQALRDTLRRLLVAHRTFDEARRPCGTSLATSHAWALLELRVAGPLTVTTLAERLNIDRTNVSRLCARMEVNGEVERVPHPEDGRARLVNLTKDGARLAERVDLSSTDHFAIVLGRLDTDMGSVIKTLDALTQAMGEQDIRENDT